MAISKQRVYQKYGEAPKAYKIVYLETSSDIVVRPDNDLDVEESLALLEAGVQSLNDNLAKLKKESEETDDELRALIEKNLKDLTDIINNLEKTLRQLIQEGDTALSNRIDQLNQALNNLQQTVNNLQQTSNSTVSDVGDLKNKFDSNGVLRKIYGGTENKVAQADSALQLVNARTFSVSLTSSASVSFNGTQNAALGVSGILPMTKGGTGAGDGPTGLYNLMHNTSTLTAANLSTADYIAIEDNSDAIAKTMQIAQLLSFLESNLDLGTTDVGNISGVLPISKGGTGKSTAATALYALISGSSSYSSMLTSMMFPVLRSGQTSANYVTFSTILSYLDSRYDAAGSSSGSLTQIFHAGASSPSNTKLLWIDTGNSGIMKYYNGSSWVAIKTAWA